MGREQFCCCSDASGGGGKKKCRSIFLPGNQPLTSMKKHRFLQAIYSPPPSFKEAGEKSPVLQQLNRLQVHISTRIQCRSLNIQQCLERVQFFKKENKLAGFLGILVDWAELKDAEATTNKVSEFRCRSHSSLE